MLALRIAGILVVLAVFAGVVAYLLTRDRRYLRLALQILKYSVIFALFLLLLLAAERILVLL